MKQNTGVRTEEGSEYLRMQGTSQSPRAAMILATLDLYEVEHVYPCYLRNRVCMAAFAWTSFVLRTSFESARAVSVLHVPLSH